MLSQPSFMYSPSLVTGFSRKQILSMSSHRESQGNNESLTVCALQLTLRHENESPWEATQRAVDSMDSIVAQQIQVGAPSIDLLVLPELAPIGYSEDSFARYLPKTQDMIEVFQEMDEAFRNKARQLQAYICYGTIGRKDDSGGQEAFGLTIRQKVINPTGEVIAVDDKIHLCDYGDCAETRFFAAGPCEPVTFDIKSFRFGIIICADIRYPELSRQLTRHGKVDVILQPAAFSRDMTFRTWSSFRETRAVENGVYFVAVNYGGLQYGESSIVPPWVDEHHEPLVAGPNDLSLIGNIRRSELAWARENLPFHKALMSAE